MSTIPISINQLFKAFVLLMPLTALSQTPLESLKHPRPAIPSAQANTSVEQLNKRLRNLESKVNSMAKQIKHMSLINKPGFIKNDKGHYVLSLNGAKIILTNNGEIVLEPTYSGSSQTRVIVGKNDLYLNSAVSTNISAIGNLNIRSFGGTTELEGGTRTEVKGPMLCLNGCGKPAARLGDNITTNNTPGGPDGVPTTGIGQIIRGSATVLIGN